MRRILLVVLLLAALLDSVQTACTPLYVRWPRVRLNLNPAIDGALPFAVCKKGCSADEDPLKSGGAGQQCSAFNHRNSPHPFSHQCQIFPKENVQHIDGYIEADDRYAFYWKYCINTEKKCTGDFAFTFLSDRYMDGREVSRVFYSKTLEGCLAECLNEGNFLCRSVSFNRTDGGCHLSQQNQLSKPALIKLNNNPNFRIDYYENNCFNVADSFNFDYKCTTEGIRVSVKSKFPYTGALYGLYDFFTCRVEPKEKTEFEYLFPYPTLSRNCSDSIRFKGNDMILEVVLSTDGVEPLYFITPDDLTYQARCPIVDVITSDGQQDGQSGVHESIETEAERLAADMLSGPERDSMHSLIKMLSAVEAKGEALNGNLKAMESLSAGTMPELLTLEGLLPHGPSTPPPTFESSSALLSTTEPSVLRTLKPLTKDVFALPLTKPTTASSSSTTTTTPAATTTTKSSTVPPTTTTKSTTTVATTKTTVQPILQPLADASSQNKTDTSVQSQLNTLDTKVDQESTSGSNRFRFNTRISFPTTNAISLSSKKSSVAFSSSNVESTSTTAFTTQEITTTSASIVAKDTTTVPPTTTTSSTTSSSTTPSTTTTTSTTSTTSTTAASTSATTSKTDQTSTPTPPPRLLPEPVSPHSSEAVSPPATSTESHSPGFVRPGIGADGKPTHAVMFDIFHNGRPTEAVVVGSRITLSFTPFYAIPPSYMHIVGCQVEPVGSMFDWEHEPLTIVKDGCQADNVGLVCPPQKTDYGIRVTVESFRYQSTMQVEYTCLVRVCPFTACPDTKCSYVDGCPRDDILSHSFGLRARRDLTFDQLNSALGKNPSYRTQLLPSSDPRRMSNSLSQQLMTLAGDHKVTKRLVVLNSDEELQYYIRTGAVPDFP